MLQVIKNDIQDPSHHTVLSVTNMENDEIQKDVLITYEEEKDGSLSVVDVPIISDTSGSVHPQDSYTIIFPPDSWDQRLTVTGTALYYGYSGGTGGINYYSPYGVRFNYTKGTANNVSHIAVTYVSTGSVYSIPDFTSDGRVVSHSVRASQNSPSQNTSYSNTNFFETNKVIYPSGAPNAGNFLTFDFTVDGKVDGYSIGF